MQLGIGVEIVGEPFALQPAQQTPFGRRDVTGSPALDRIAASCGATIDAMALAAVLAQPWADLALSGAVTVDQLRTNAKALDVHLPESTLEELSRLAEPPEQYWRTRASLPWR